MFVTLKNIRRVIDGRYKAFLFLHILRGEGGSKDCSLGQSRVLLRCLWWLVMNCFSDYNWRLNNFKMWKMQISWKRHASRIQPSMANCRDSVNVKKSSELGLWLGSRLGCDTASNIVGLKWASWSWNWVLKNVLSTKKLMFRFCSCTSRYLSLTAVGSKNR